MIFGVCADKGSPGVSSVAAALAMVLPGRRLLVECDPSGGDAPFRLRGVGGEWLAPEPWLGSLATEARLGTPDPFMFGQDCLLGFPVIVGGTDERRFTAVKSRWPQVADALAAADGAVVADLGRMHANHAAWPVADRASVLWVVGRSDTAGLAHLRARMSTLLEQVGLGPDGAPSVMGLVVSPYPDTRRGRRSSAAAESMLEASAIPAPIVGVIPRDPQGADSLWAGPVTRQLAGSPLVRAVQAAARETLRLRPDVAAALAATPAGLEAVGVDDSVESPANDAGPKAPIRQEAAGE